MNTENDSVENSSTDNSKALSDLIQSIQAKMNTENMESTEENQKVNIDNTNTNNNNSSNISSILNNLDLSSILGAFNNNNNSNNNTNSNSNNNTFSGIDPSFLLKAQKVMSSVTRDDPKKNLLLSLKPFLRQSRQDKINEYISMLSIISAIEAFSDKGSDKNV